MGVDVRLALVVSAVVTASLWAIALVMHRVDPRVTAHGLRNGAVVALLLFGGSVAAVSLLAAPIEAALLIGATLGVGYFWLGSTLIPIGLIVGSKPAWTTVGAWAAVPIIVVSLGLGYTAYRSVESQSSGPTTANGTITINLSGTSSRPLTASGVATCTPDGSGNMTVVSGTTGNEAVMSSDGRVVQVTFDLDSNATRPAISLTVGNEVAIPGRGWDAGLHTITLDAGSTPQAGHATLTGIVPLDAAGQPRVDASWSGDFEWSCRS